MQRHISLALVCLLVSVIGVGPLPLHAQSSSATFSRGDCNNDGAYNIADAISALNAFFGSGTVPGCLDACDVNDDGGFNIADAVSILSSIFVAGSPPPAAPTFPDCGADPTTDGLDCATQPTAGCASSSFTLDDSIELQQQVWQTVFTTPFDVETEFTYPLDNPVIESGLYSGLSIQGEPFVLDVRSTIPIDITSPDLAITDAERSWALAEGLEYSGVFGVLQSPNGEIPIFGLAVYVGGIDDSRLLVTGISDEATLALFDPALPAVGANIALVWPSVELCLEFNEYCLDPTCVADCQDDYTQAVDAAEAAHTAETQAAETAFNIAETAAAQTRNIAINAANASYNVARTAAQNTFATAAIACTAAITAAHIGCAFVTAVLWWTGGAATLACVLAAQASYAICLGLATAALNGAINAAQATRTIAVDAANASYAVAVAAAQATYDAAVAAAAAALEAALAAAESALEECLGACPWIVCGTFMIYIFIF